MRKMMAITLIAIVLTPALAVPPADPASSEKAELMKVLDVVVLFKLAEETTHSRSGKFLPYAELVKSGALAETAKGPLSLAYKRLRLENEAEPLEGFGLAMMISQDGTAYKLSLEQKKKCGAAFFTSGTGVIYFGKPLGCPI